MFGINLLDVFSHLAYALLTTWLIEGTVMFFMTRSRKYLVYNIWCNSFTNPILNVIGLFVMHFFGKKAFVIFMCFGEIAVLFGEAKLYFIFDTVSGKECLNAKRYFFLSLVTNACSLVLGTLILYPTSIFQNMFRLLFRP